MILRLGGNLWLLRIISYSSSKMEPDMDSQTQIEQ